MKGAGGRLGTIILMVALVGTACDRSAPEQTHLEARESFCADLLDLVVKRSDRGDDLGARLKRGARELEQARDELTETVHRVAQALAEKPPQDVHVTVYLTDDESAAQRAAIERRLAAIPSAGTPRFVSPRQAYRELVESNSDRPELYENVRASALPASYRLILDADVDADALIADLEGLGGVDQARASDPLAGIEETKALLDACAPIEATG